MSPLFPALLVVASFALVAPAGAQQGLSGTWTLSLDTEPAQTVEASIQQNGTAVTAQISSASGPVDAEGTFVDGVLTLYYTAYMNGQPTEVTLSASLTDEGMAGALLLNNSTEISFTGKRKS
jgi:hypothetical protein